MTLEELQSIARNGLEDVKADNIVEINVQDVSDYADVVYVASGKTNRQVKALAQRVIEYAKEAGHPPVGVEGESASEWILVDLGRVVVHVMLPWVRDYYAIEKLWSDDGSTAPDTIAKAL